MSIENNLKRIADALEALVAQKTVTAEQVAEVITPAPAAPAAPAPAPAAPQMTPEELNTALVAEFQRLGSREGIDGVMAEMGVTSITDLAADQYPVLLDKVKAL